MQEEKEFAGWLIIVDGLKPLWDSVGPRLFTNIEEAEAKRGWMDTMPPVTQARYDELCRRFAKKGGKGKDNGL